MNRAFVLQIVGWLLFVISALLFLVDSVRQRNVIGFFASLAFFIACFLFIGALINSRTSD